MGLLNTQHTKAATGGSTSAEKVLIADANKMLCDLAKYHLERDGFAIDIINDGEEIRTATIGGYNAIVLDYDLLGEKTYEFINQHYISGDARGVPLIITHVPKPHSSVYETLDAGADALMPKPYSMKELAARLRAIMRRHRKPHTPR